MPTQTLYGTSLPESTSNLVTLESALAQLPELSEAKAAALPAAIEAASEAVRQWCRRDFVQIARDERYDGDGSWEMILDHFPVIAISSIRIDGESDPEAFEEIDAADIKFKAKTGEVRILSGNLREGWQNIRVQYTAGYPTVPGPVQQATIQTAKALIDQAVRDTTIDEERWADYSFQRSDNRKDYGIPETAKDFLAPYRDYT